MARKTLLQRRFVEALPRNGFKISSAAREAGYSEETANTQAKRIMESKGVKELSEEVGFSMTKEELLKEYEFIGKQRKDLTNKRAVVENILAHKDPKLDFRANSKLNTGNTYNTQINIIDPKERALRIKALEESLLLNQGKDTGNTMNS